MTTESPLFPDCIFGKHNRRLWRDRGKPKKHIRRTDQNFADANTSTDQMISSHPGLIPQRSGLLMKAKYHGATIFVDHHTDFTYIHLMHDFTSEDTLEAKHAYECLNASYDIRILRYHVDNERFSEMSFIKDIKENDQHITYCGVGSHHQNGIVEKIFMI